MYAKRGHLAWIVDAALVVRVVAVFVYPPGLSLYSDMAAYDRVARSMLSGSVGPMDTLYAPGYPAFLALLYALLGRRLLVVGLVQATLGAATCWLAADIAKRWSGSDRLALVTAGVLAVYPPLVYYSALLLTESMAPFVWTLAIWLLVLAGERNDERGWVYAGLALGAAVLVRSNFLLWLPFAALLALGTREVTRGRRIRAAACVVGATLVVAGAAAARSSLTLGRLAGPSTNGGVNFFMLQADVRGVRSPERTYVPVRNAFKYAQLYDAPVPLYDEKYFYREGVDWFLRRSDKMSHLVSNVAEGVGLGRQAYWPAETVGAAPQTTLEAFAQTVLRLSSRAWVGLIVVPLLGISTLVVSGRSLSRTEVAALAVALTSVGVHVLTSVLFLADPRMHVPFDPVLIAALMVLGARAATPVNSRLGLASKVQASQ